MSGVLSRRLASGLVAVSLAAASSARAQPFQRIDCSGDVTDELQLAIDQNDGSVDYANIQLSDGTCILHETIEICNIEGLRIEGTGPGGTTLQWLPDDPDDEGPMFSLQNSAGVAFSGFSVCLGGTESNKVTLDSVFDMYNACFDCEHDVDRCSPSVVWGGGSSIGYYPGSLPHSHANSFTHIEIASCVGEWGVLNHGARIKLFGERDQLTEAEIDTACAPTNLNSLDTMYQAYRDNPNSDSEWEGHLRADCYNEHHSFTDVSVSEFRDSAFVVEGRNSLGNTFTNVHCDGLFQKDTQGPVIQGGSGRVCVETGQNRWVLDGNNQMDHVHVYVGGNIHTQLPVGSELGASTQGQFFWYGGTAKNLSEAVFVLGCSSSPIHIVGLAAKRCRALIKALVPDLVRSGFPLLVESVQFDTDGVHAWDHARSFFPGNPYGIVVDFPYHGPLIIRDSVFGDCPVDGIPADVEPDNVSFYWNYESIGDGPRGSFVFESNAFSTKIENPFVPVSSLDGNTFTLSQGIGIYPTYQQANLVCTQTLDDLPWHWESMPQHFTDLDVTTLPFPPVYDLSQPSTSREHYLLHGAGSLDDFDGGVVGQELVLIGGMDSSVTVEHGHGKIELRQGNSYVMTHGHTLWLVYDPDGCWREIGRGENSF